MLNLLNFWFPWFIFFNDIWLLQLLILYILILIYLTKNVYYFLLYIFLEIILFGIYLSLAQSELFTGFLWVLEFTIIFIVLIFLFYLNVEGNYFFFFYNFNYIYIFFFFFFFKINFIFYNINFINLYNNIFFWDDFYESIFNYIMNDFLVLTISYYSFNNIELLILGLLLLVGSIICIIFNKNIKIIKNTNFNYLSSHLYKMIFFFQYYFLRKQNFNKQPLNKANLKMFKKKKW